jgi:hypothetical protein
MISHGIRNDGPAIWPICENPQHTLFPSSSNDPRLGVRLAQYGTVVHGGRESGSLNNISTCDCRDCTPLRGCKDIFCTGDSRTSVGVPSPRTCARIKSVGSMEVNPMVKPYGPRGGVG